MTKKTEKNQKFQIQFDFDYKGNKGKEVNPESNTQPEMTLTVRQLLVNHTRGIDSKTQVKTPLYFDMEIPTINDITDVTEYRQALQERLEATEKFIKEERAQIAEEKAKEEELQKTLENGPTKQNTEHKEPQSSK